MGWRGDTFTVEVWHVTPVTDAAGGVTLQVAGPLGEIAGLLGRGKGRLRRLGIGEDVNYDVYVLIRNFPDNQWFWAYQESEPWLYFIVTDTTSGWYGAILRGETIVPSGRRQTDFSYHTICLCVEMKGTDKVKYEDGELIAKS